MAVIKINEAELRQTIHEAVSWVLGNERPMPNSVVKLIDKYCNGRLAYEKCIGSGTESKKFKEYQEEYNKFLAGEEISKDFLNKLFSTYRNTLDSLNNVSNRDAKKYAHYKDIEKQLKARGFNVEDLYKTFLSEHGE